MKEWLAQLKSIFSASDQASLYLVGGSVRDQLLGNTPRDLDLVTTLAPDTLQQAGFRLVTGRTTTPIWFRHLPGTGNLEVSVLPEETPLIVELQRRDFTINAMAVSLSGALIDPLQGQADLMRGVLKVCNTTSFSADPLRLFRGFRFEADGFQFDPATEAQIRRYDWSTAFNAIPVERFTCEMVKALSAKSPALFFQRMLELKVGSHWLPELFQMPRVPAGPLQYHPEGDLFNHSIQVMQRVAELSDNALSRFCGLFHDIGKLSTDPACYPRHHGHDEAGFEPALLLCRRIKLPVEWGRALAWTARLHTKANNWAELRTATKIRLASQALKADLHAILPVVSTADKHGIGRMDGWEGALQIAGMNLEQLGLTVAQIEKLSLEKRAGYLLQKRVELLAEQLRVTNQGVRRI